jgi:phosphoserine phosphatase
MTSDLVRIAAFDLDDTVVDCNSQAAFVRFLKEKRLAPPSLLIEVAFWFALNRIGCRLDVPKIHARLISRLSSVPRDRLETAMHEFSETRLKPRIRRDAEQWMSRVRADGCHVLLLSASLEPMAALIAESMEADGYACTRVDFDRPGRLAVNGELIYGEAKLRALHEYANGRFPSWRLEYAFGNDYADRFVLSAARNAIAVCPSARLRALAEKEGWSRMMWQ